MSRIQTLLTKIESLAEHESCIEFAKRNLFTKDNQGIFSAAWGLPLKTRANMVIALNRPQKIIECLDLTYF